VQEHAGERILQCLPTADPIATLNLSPLLCSIYVCRPQLGRGVQEYISAANGEVTLLIQCETRPCYEGLEASAVPCHAMLRCAVLRLELIVHTACCCRCICRGAYVDPWCQRSSPASLPPALYSPQDVLSVPGVDCCFVGPVDLSHALGLAQHLGFPACFDSPEFKV